jgi:drug/metabolite transporter (DMT)-like permease
MSRKGFLLFIAASVAWGVPYFFVRIAAEEFSPSMIIFARTILGAVVLIPLAIKRNSLRPALKAWKYVLAFAVIEMVIPWWMLTTAQSGNPVHINSGLAGLLIGTVPFFSLFLGYFYMRDKSVFHPKTIFGLVTGFVGLFLLVGIDAFEGHIDPFWVGVVIIGAIGYAIAPTIVAKNASQVPSEGVISISMVIVAAIYAIPAFAQPFQPGVTEATSDGWIALAVLGVVCSAIAFVVFFALIKEIGSTRATLITYPNTLIAILLGVTFLQEPFTPGMMVGVPLVILGSYFATRKH